jgi:polyisoprenoid-binding protein YceI
MSARTLSAIAIALLGPWPAVAAAPQAWVVDRGASSLRFASSVAGEGFSGTFRRWDADIRFDPNNLAGSSVDARIDVGSATTGNADRDQALPTDTFLDAARFPRATFVAHGFSALGPGRYRAAGVLTLRGVSRPVVLPFTLTLTGAQAKMTGTAAVDRLAFGVGQGEWKATTTIPAVVTVSIALTAHRSP